MGTNAACTGTGYSAVSYPLWPVKIGDGTSPAEYVVPNGYCYANACLEDFAAVGTATAFKGVEKLSALQSSPDMLPTLLLRQTLVDAPTRLVQLRLLPGTVVRPSSKFAQRPLLYWELLLETARKRS